MIFVAGVLAGTAPEPVAEAPSPTDVATATPAETPSKPEKLICKRDTKVGSRLAQKKVCYTKLEWIDQQRQVRTVIDRIQTGRRVCSINASAGHC